MGIWTTAGLSLLLTAAGAAFHLLNSLAEVPGHPYWLGNSLGAVSFGLLGALILTYRPGHRIGHLFVVGSVLAATSNFAGEYGPYALLGRSDQLPAGAFFAWIGNWSWWPALGTLAASLLVFPDGHLRSRRWRMAAGALGLGVALAMLSDALEPGPMRLMPASNPLGVPGAIGVLDGAHTAGALLAVAGALAGVIGVLVRLGRASGVERQQLKWFAYASGVSILLLVGTLVLDGLIGVRVLGPLGGALGSSVLLPAALAVAILRYQLFAIDRLINRTLVYVALSLIVGLLYLALVGSASALVQGRATTAVSLLVTAVVAVIFQPLRAWLQQATNRLLYGQRDEPYAVISALGQRLEATLAPEAVLPTIVQTVASALNLSSVALVLTGTSSEAPAAAVGSPVEPLMRLPLVYQHAAVGELVLGARGQGEPLTPADEALLRDLARQAGMAVHAVRLTADLQQARERLVSAREEERRRLRRDLHDGLGPQLASLTFSIEAARTLIPRDPAAADVLLRELRGHAQAAIADIRRLVYALRPPALDDLGLIAAIREHATHSAMAPLQVAVQGPESLPVLPAAVEVAAYRIVQEALTNVVRHAGARTCLVRLACPTQGEAALHLLIEDDGRGLPADLRAGVGLTSMRERAVELGGTCAITSGSTGGTRVQVVLPLAPQSAPDRAPPQSGAPSGQLQDVPSQAHPAADEPVRVGGRVAEHG